MSAQAPQLPANAGNLVYSRADTVDVGISGYIFQYDTGWTYRYNAAGEFTGSTFSQPSGPAGTRAVSASTGVNPNETGYSLYGHTIPLLVLGRGRVGGDIISGPTVANGNASGINSFGVQADPTRTLTLIEIAFDSDVIWQGTCVGDPSAAVTPSSSGFTSEPFTVRFYTGSLTQPADPLETVPYGTNAVAYRGQVLLAFDNLPLANTKFKKYPYVSARFVDQDGEAINFGDAFEMLAYGPYVGLTSDQFVTSGITDGVPDGGFIITQDTEFLSLIQQYGRFYQNWDILQTDKLRIVDRGDTVTPDIVLDKSNLMGQVTIARAKPDSVPRELTLSTIDPDADYTIVPSKASFPRDPVAVSTSVKTESQYLPVIMDSATRTAIVTFAKYNEEIARKTVTVTAMIRGLEIEPGDLLGLADLADGIGDEVFKVKETTHGANHSVEIIAQSFMDCNLDLGPCPVVTPSEFDTGTAANVTLSNGNLTVVNNLSNSDTNQGARVALTSARDDCRYYFEITQDVNAGGWEVGVGVVKTTQGFSGFSGGGANGVWLDTGSGSTNLFSNGSLSATTGIPPGATIGIAVDMDNGKVWMCDASGGDWNGDPAADPATNTGGAALIAGLMTPVVTFGGFTGASGNQFTANFGASAFVGTVPTGFGPGWPV